MDQNKIDQISKLLTELLESDAKTNNIDLTSPLIFKGDNLDGKGLLWSGRGYTKQLVFSSNPDRIFISENIDIAKGKNITINNLPVLSENTLGTGITKSYLREVGRLKGLIVDGSVSVNNYLFYDGNNDRLGIGTDSPKSAIDIVENNVEILLGSTEINVGSVGTFNSQDFALLTDNTARLTICANGNIVLGNTNSGPIHVNVIGKLSVNVNTPDSRAGLHVNGAIKFNNKIHVSGTSAPSGGSYSEGDICWNTEPQPGGHVGWVCVRAGNPGLWHPYGRID